MNDIKELLWWYGDWATVDLFVVVQEVVAPSVDWIVEGVVPDEVDVWLLEDETNVLNSGRVYAYDLQFSSLTETFRSYLEVVLKRICASPGRVAWLGFEGSFSFDELLTERTAPHIYGVCAEGEEPMVTLDYQEIKSEAWKGTVSRFRSHLDLA